MVVDAVSREVHSPRTKLSVGREYLREMIFDEIKVARLRAADDDAHESGFGTEVFPYSANRVSIRSRHSILSRASGHRNRLVTFQSLKIFSERAGVFVHDRLVAGHCNDTYLHFSNCRLQCPLPHGHSIQWLDEDAFG